MDLGSSLQELNKRSSEIERAAEHWLVRFASRYGLAVVVLLAAPAVIYFGWLVSPAGYQPLTFAARPDDAALRSELGPPRVVKTPEFVKGLYVTSDTVGSAKRFGHLVDLARRTEINALVIDVKDHRGQIAFATDDRRLAPFQQSNPSLGRLAEFTSGLRQQGLYLIARVPVFPDQALAQKRSDLALKRGDGSLWRDSLGLLWLDPASNDVWKYNVAVGEAAFAGGFDEVQFDYIRFPSDGSLGSIRYPVYDGKLAKAKVIANLFAYFDKELRQKRGIPISADLFGLTMWQHESDLGIGQRLMDAAPRLDFVSPMVYPSHYPPGFEGFANPALYPYEVVYRNLVRGNELLETMNRNNAVLAEADPPVPVPRLATLRPWIQDFDMGAVYDVARVRAQMRAAADGGASGWLIWNAANNYTESALEQDQ